MKATRITALLLLISLLLSFSLLFSSCGGKNAGPETDKGESGTAKIPAGPGKDKGESGTAKIPAGPGETIDLSAIPAYTSLSYYPVNGNTPAFGKDEITSKSYEYYSPLDSLDRCGYAVSCIGKDLMPRDGEERGSIGSVTPSGWVQASYPSLSLPYLYNRSHIIGWQLTAENANQRNLVTGTRFMNTNMITYENMIADYVKETGNHVMYRVEPIYDGDDLVPSGLHMEAYSVEDAGYGVSFNVYLYNVQPGVTIDYRTGRSRLTGSAGGEGTEEVLTYCVNTSTKKFHLATCRYSTSKNVVKMTATRSELIAQGYDPCGVCKP